MKNWKIECINIKTGETFTAESIGSHSDKSLFNLIETIRSISSNIEIGKVTEMCNVDR